MSVKSLGSFKRLPSEYKKGKTYWIYKGLIQKSF